MGNNNQEQCDVFQRHNHEVLGSTMLAAPEGATELLHNHRFAGTTGPAQPVQGGHIHVICIDTDFFFNHFHSVEIKTGLPIPVSDQDGNIIGHVHGFAGTTSCTFFHEHEFKGSTLIQNPIGSFEENQCSQITENVKNWLLSK